MPRKKKVVEEEHIEDTAQKQEKAPAKKKTKKDVAPDEIAEISEDTPVSEEADIAETNENDNEDVTAESGQDYPSYILQNEMNLDEIQDFVDDIAKQISEQDTVYIDLEKCETITTPLIQAIICLNRHAEDAEKKLLWQNPTSGFSDAFNNLGFYSEMMKLEFAA